MVGVLIGMRAAAGEIQGEVIALVLPLLAAMVAGGLIGAERERHGRAAGLRTTLLVCLAGCVAMMLSVRLGGPDVARLAAGVLSGMGFLGAGVIVREHTHLIRGVTTAATLWFSSVIGLVLGAGLYLLGGLATVVVLVVLHLVPRVEKGIENDWYSDLEVAAEGTALDLKVLQEMLQKLAVTVKEVDWSEDLVAGERLFRLHLKYAKGMRQVLPGMIVTNLSTLRGIKRIHWRA